jgi:UDP-glucuronate decarboxylase
MAATSTNRAGCKGTGIRYIPLGRAGNGIQEGRQLMRILVTGGAGFIGSAPLRTPAERRHDVICLDNFFTGSKDNIIHLMDNHRFELIRHDITEPILLEVDRIYNLACPASPVHYQYNPVKTVKTSVMGMINMLGMAKRVKARILQASTSEVYGDPQVHPQNRGVLGQRQSHRHPQLLR